MQAGQRTGDAPGGGADHREGPFRPLDLGPRSVVSAARGDGGFVLRSAEALGSHPVSLTERIVDGARSHPDRTMLAQRTGPGHAWRRLSYAEVERAMRAVGQALLDRELSPERPVVILSGASLEHAIVAYAAMHVGVPYAPVSPAYSLLSTDHRKLSHVLDLLSPGLLVCDDHGRYAQAIAAAAPHDCEVVAVKPTDPAATPFARLLSTPPTGLVDAAAAQVGPDTIAKILFTSGSTGLPKGVINTQRMLCSAQQMFAQAFPFLAAKPPVIVDWLPWHHTSGANQVLGMVPYLGGSLYIDDGKPTAEGMATTVDNLKDVVPTAYFTVPKGLAELVPHLRRDAAFARSFFESVDFVFYSGAALSDAVLRAFDELAVAATGFRTPIMSAYGATETAPFALVANWPSEETGLAGVPLPGVELKLAPSQGKLEARLKGPNVTPGYWRQPELTARAFDEEGFLCFGDAMAFAADDPAAGLRFDGRLSEDFKLSTGTWVNVGALRAALLAQGGMAVHDVVICGEGQDEVGALVFLALEACAAIAGAPLGDHAAAAAHPRVRAHLRSVLDRLAGRSTGSSTVVARALPLASAPAAEAGEVTDKGSLNARAVLANRAAEFAALHAVPPDNRVVLTSRADGARN
jgi:feruloyl-CoA synthase